MGIKTGIATMVKALEDLNIIELKTELRIRQLDTKGKLERAVRCLRSPYVENENKSVSEGRVGEILNYDESVDLQKSLIPEVRIEPFGGIIRDHTGIDEAMEMVCQGLCR